MLAFATVLLLLTSCGEIAQPVAGTDPPPDTPASTQPATVRTDDGLEFDAIVEVPVPARRNGWGVLMIGGGFGNDLDWTVPGSIDVEGDQMQMTISGETHADGPAISAALAERGFVVMRWSTIARGDPLADQWPVRATTRSLPELVVQASDALRTLRETGLVEHGRVILLGHSLGAARACTIAADDRGVKALILLAPAYFTGDADAATSLESKGMRLSEDALRTRPIPCLALFGELDTSRAVNAPAAAALADAEGLAHLQVRLIPNLGHQLAPTDQGRHGPIDPQILTDLAAWAEALARDVDD
jgi:pimeloyl-ACP methyl ester carboxylesterase